MSQVPGELKYTKTHEWLLINSDGSVTVGISDHAQELLGDMVYIELPEAETQLEAGAECAVVESVKAASDVYAPISGKVIETNAQLADSPEVVNKDPYGEGWMFRIKPSDDSQLETLLNADDYEAVVAADEH